MDDTKSIPLFQMVDAVQFYVPDIDAGVRYYGDILWHEIIWKTEFEVGLHMPGSETEIVIQNERDYQEIDLSVESADAAARRIEDAGHAALRHLNWPSRRLRGPVEQPHGSVGLLQGAPYH